MTEQLALFDLPPAPAARSFSDFGVDTKGYDPSWVEVAPASSTEKTGKPSKFNCGDRAAIAGGDRIGTTGTVIDTNGRWVSVEFEAGGTEVLPEVELVPAPKPIRRSKSRPRASGWIETELRTYEGKTKTSSYVYHHYRYEVWQGGKLLRTPSRRLSWSQVDWVSQWIADNFTVDEILDALSTSTESVAKHRRADWADIRDSSLPLGKCGDKTS